jgi:hypothetical protein
MTPREALLHRIPYHRQTAHLDLFRRLEGSPRLRSRAAARPRSDVLFQPDWARSKPRDRFGEVWSLRIARRGAFADSEQLGHFGESEELQRHAENGRGSIGSCP